MTFDETLIDWENHSYAVIEGATADITTQAHRILRLIQIIRNHQEALDWYAEEGVSKESEWYRAKLFTKAQRTIQECEEILNHE